MDQADFNVPADLADRVAGELSPGERVVWVGQPRVDLAVRPAYLLVPFGAFFTLFALIWTAVAGLITAGIMAPCGLVFVTVGLGLILSPIWLRGIARKTVYVLTDRRAIIWQPSWFGRVTVQSFTAPGLGQISRTERPDGSGDLIFQISTTGFGDNSRTVRRGFIAINGVREIEQLVQQTLQPSR